MTALDLLLIVVFVTSVVYGLWRGIIMQVGQAGGVLAGIVACRMFTPLLLEHFAGDEGAYNPQGTYVDTVIINLVVFLVAYFGIRMLSRVLSHAVRTLHLRPMDRIAGAVFSLFEWMLGLSLLLNVGNVLMPDADIPHRSRLSGGRAIQAVMDLAPDLLGGLNVSQLLDLSEPGYGSPSSADNKVGTEIVTD